MSPPNRRFGSAGSREHGLPGARSRDGQVVVEAGVFLGAGEEFIWVPQIMPKGDVRKPPTNYIYIYILYT